MPCKAWPTRGDRMKFLGENGYDHELAEALKIFEVGHLYEVEDCDVGDWHHSVTFVGIKGRWNGVMFGFDVPDPIAPPMPPDPKPPSAEAMEAARRIPHAPGCLGELTRALDAFAAQAVAAAVAVEREHLRSDLRSVRAMAKASSFFTDADRSAVEQVAEFLEHQMAGRQP